MTKALVRNGEGLWPVILSVELRGLDPLTPSLRTARIAVDQACLSTDLGVRTHGSPVEVNGVAVLSCCTSDPPVGLRLICVWATRERVHGTATALVV
jgi:hypothetical protein